MEVAESAAGLLIYKELVKNITKGIIKIHYNSYFKQFRQVILPCVWALTAGNGTNIFPSMNTGIIQLLIN
jgi:hypothetical protein